MARNKAGQLIVNMEARRDGHGRLAVYRLPSNDGGGSYEVAGINDRYHPATAKKLRSLIMTGKHTQAEALAVEYICTYTDPVVRDITHPGVAYLIRDIAFNRGPSGAMNIVRMALNLPVAKPGWHPWTDAELETIKAAEQTPDKLIDAITEAREAYEYKVVGRRTNLDRGLRNRWSKAREAALNFDK